MKMCSPFDFEVVLKNTSSSVADYFSGNNCFSSEYSFCEPISVLDSRIPSRRTSSSTLSSSLGGGSSGSGGGASTDTAAVVSPYPKWQQDSTTDTSSTAGGIDSELLPVPPSLEVAVECAMEGWESVLSESAAVSPCHEQSIFRWIMGDVGDPSINERPSKFLQFAGATANINAVSTAAEFDLRGGFGITDQAFAGANLCANFLNSSSYERIDSAANHLSSNPIKFHQNSENLIYHPPAFGSSADLKRNPQLLIHQHQAQSFFSEDQEQTAPAPPPAKRLNSGGPFVEARQQLNHQYLQLLHHPHHRPKMSGGDELQQQIIDHLYKAAELLQTGNPSLAQEILARLNHHLSPIGKPFQRAAFYCKEALQQLLRSTTTNPSAASVVLKIDAYKSFSEISPLIDFANFTTNQALLEVLEGFHQIHIIDFDIGYGGQWASLMQELSLTSGGAATTVLKVSAVVSPTTHNELELTLTRENLTQFANEINIGFEFNILSIESLKSNSWSLPLHSSDNEAVAVNIPVGSVTNYEALRFVKQLSPKIVVSVNRGCDRPELTFPNHIIHALHSYSILLESLDAVNVNPDTLQNIERFLIQPGMEKLVMKRLSAPEKSHDWRSLFVSCGFSPVSFSKWTESQGEYIVKKIGVVGFEVEKRQSSLVLCWQRKEVLSVSMWSCSNL